MSRTGAAWSYRVGLCLLASMSICAVPPAAIAQAVGNVGAVNPATTGTPPGGAVRTLVLGANVVQRERIQTSSEGTAQITFRDRSTLNVGRSSSIVIDEFVYDPNTGAGRMAVSLARGVLRSVGGQVSHAGNATIRTPAATLGVRGGIVTVAYFGNDRLAARPRAKLSDRAPRRSRR
jgi:hypothetical protein